MNNRDNVGTWLTRCLLIGAGLVLSFGLFANCASESPVPDPEPMPQGGSFQGVWYSPQFERMFLTQDGDKVTGVYTYETGGRIEGTVSGNTLVFDWTDSGEKETATRKMSGRGYFQLVKSNDTLELKGKWGYDDQVTGGGPWEADYIRELEDDDPTTLEELDS